MDICLFCTKLSPLCCLLPFSAFGFFMMSDITAHRLLTFCHFQITKCVKARISSSICIFGKMCNSSLFFIIVLSFTLRILSQFSAKYHTLCLALLNKQWHLYPMLGFKCWELLKIAFSTNCYKHLWVFKHAVQQKRSVWKNAKASFSAFFCFPKHDCTIPDASTLLTKV